MKYQIGDRVLILHSNEEAEIIEIINDKMVMVEADGVKFPVYMDQIDFPYFKRFSEKKIFPAKKEKKYVDDLKQEKKIKELPAADGVWLSFLPIMSTDEFGDEVVDELKLHLVNRTGLDYKFKYSQFFLGEKNFGLTNEINAFSDFYLHDIDFADMNDNPGFEFEFRLLKPDKKKAEHYEAMVKTRAKQIFSKIEELKKRNEATFSFRLFEQYPDKAPEEDYGLDKLSAMGYKVYDAKKAKQHLPLPQSVIDLHIEKITDDWKGLSNYEILRIQLKTFEKYYDLALAHMQSSLIVIHGVGEGRLRDEIHELLRSKREVASYVNQYDPRFGYGATEIFFQY